METSRELFERKGVTGTSLREIGAMAGITKGSLAFHFPGGKQEIVRAAIAAATAEVSDVLDAGLWTESGLVQGFETMSEMVAAQLERSDWAYGCPISTVVLEQSGDEQIRLACARGFEAWAHVAARRFEHEGIPPQRARALAGLGLTTIVGALIVARAQRDTTVILESSAIVAAVFTEAIATARKYTASTSSAAGGPDVHP